MKGGESQLCSPISVLLLTVPEAVSPYTKGADQLCGSFSEFILAVPEAVLSHIRVRSRSVVQFIPCVAPCCSRGSLVPYKSKEHQFHQVLALQGRLAQGIRVPMIFGKLRAYTILKAMGRTKLIHPVIAVLSV